MGSSSSSSGSSDSSESGHYNGTSGSESGESSVIETWVSAARRLRDSDSSSSDSTCDYESTPEVTALILDTCLPVDDSESAKITCTDFHDAVVEYFENDPHHECSGTATHTAPASAFFGDDCEHMVACNVVAGEEYESHLDGHDAHDAAPTAAALLTSLLITLA